MPIRQERSDVNATSGRGKVRRGRLLLPPTSLCERTLCLEACICKVISFGLGLADLKFWLLEVLLLLCLLSGT